MIPTCPPPAALSALLDESLPDADRRTLEGHVETCPACQVWLDAHASGPAGVIPPAPADAPPAALARWLAPPVPVGLSAGSRLCPCLIKAVVGRGGMGVVYRATDTVLGRAVAVKVLSAALGPDSAARFVREAQAAARVRHDSIVPVYAAVDPPGGPAHLVMEFVDGPTLRRAATDARGLDPRRAAEVAAQVADALAAAHAAGLVHRDVKPANVLLDATTGRAKLTDFGLAQAADAAELTRSGMVVGTPAYMAPEQVRNPTTSGPPADVYGLGATLYEALTGAEPFRGSLELVLAQVLADDPLPPRRLNPAVPRDLDTVCLKAMAKDPARRYPSAAAVRDDLRRWLAGEPVLARPVNWWGRGKRWAVRNPTAAGLAAALTVGSAFAFAAVTWLWLAAAASAKEARESAAVATAERVQADQDYHRAEGVVTTFYQKMSEGGTVAAPINLETRLELIRDAIGFYEEVAVRRPGEKPPAELAAAHARKGVLHNMAKETAPAAASFRTALALFEQAEHGGPVDPKRKREYAECHFYLGVSAGRAEEVSAAVANYEAAATRLAPLAEADPQASYFLAGALGNLAGVDEYRGETDRARAAHEQAMPVHRHAHATDPKNGGAFQDLVWTTLSVARLQRDAKVALAQLTAAGPLIEQYGTEYPNDFSRADVSCSYHQELSAALLRTGDRVGALKSAEEAVRHVKELASFPPQFQQPWVQAGAWSALAEARSARGDVPAAEADWIKAAQLYEAQPWTGLVSGMLKGKLAAVYDRLAAAAANRGDAVGNASRKTQAADVRERLKREHPGFKPGG